MKKMINIILSIISLLFLITTIQLVSEKNYGASFVGMIFTIGVMYLPIKYYLSKEKSTQKVNKKENVLKPEEKKNVNCEEQSWIKKNKFFYINEKEQKVKINNHEYNFKDILSYELLTDDSSVLKTNTGSALTKLLLFGDIIGGTTSKKKNINYCTKLQIKITINNLSNPTEYINFMVGFNKLKKGSILYNRASEDANECLSLLTIITNYNK